MPSHLALTIHEIVAHATEVDRIAGYEANYAGTSFVKISDIGKLKYGSPRFNVTADRTFPTGMATVAFDDDGVKAQKWPIVRTAFSWDFRPIARQRISSTRTSAAAAPSPTIGASTRSCGCRTSSSSLAPRDRPTSTR